MTTELAIMLVVLAVNVGCLAFVIWCAVKVHRMWISY